MTGVPFSPGGVDAIGVGLSHKVSGVGSSSSSGSTVAKRTFLVSGLLIGGDTTGGRVFEAAGLATGRFTGAAGAAAFATTSFWPEIPAVGWMEWAIVIMVEHSSRYMI